MRMRRKVLSLIMAGAMALQGCPFTAESASVQGDEWYYETYYDREGNIVLRDVQYCGSESDIYVPEEIDGYPVVQLDFLSFFGEYNYNKDITIHIPDSVQADGDAQLMSGFDSVTIVRSTGEPQVYYPVKWGEEIDGFINRDKNLNDFDPEAWEYRILDGLEGVYDGPCVELLKYKGSHLGMIECPLKLEGYPVVKIGGKIFEDIPEKHYIMFYIPAYVTNNIYDYSDEISNEDKYAEFYRNVAVQDFPKIQLTDGCLDYNGNLDIDFVEYTLNDDYDPDAKPPSVSEDEENYSNEYYDYINSSKEPWSCLEYSYAETYHLETSSENPDEHWWSLKQFNNNYMLNLDVPENIGGIPVRSISITSSSARKGAEPVTITLPDTVDYIAPFSFSEMLVRSINIPEKVKFLPYGCFDDCRFLDEIKGIDNVPFVSDALFSSYYGRYSGGYINPFSSSSWKINYELWNEVVPEDNLVLINTPQGMGSDVTIMEPFMMTDPDTGYTYRVTIGENDHELSFELIYMPDPTDEIPTEFRGYPVKVALSETKPLGAKIVIPEGKEKFTIDDMKYYVYDYEGARKKYIPVTSYSFEELQESVSEYQSAFSTDIEIKSKNVEIGTKAFRSSGVTSLEFPGSATLDENALTDNSYLTDIAFSGENSDIRIGNFAAGDLLSLSSIKFPEKCHDLYIGERAFSRNACKNIVLPEGTSYVGESAFSRGAVEELSINGSPKIAKNAFNGCNSLKKITINGKPELDDEAFFKCLYLEDLDIDPSAEINGTAFSDCEKLKTINGESIFDEKGEPKKKYVDFIKKNFTGADDCGFVNDYTMYLIKKTVAEVVDDDMSDIQKIKAIHDKICSMVSYDNGNIGDKKNHTDISIFLSESTVCEGYARAMNLMLHEAGIESCYVYSEDHAWVIVRLGDHYFHVDTTWDDGDVVTYDWFLKTDEEIKPKDSHHLWSIGVPSSLHRFQSVRMPACEDKMGDVNLDSIVDGRDATEILTNYAMASVGDEMNIDIVLSDCDFNGMIDARDASAVLTAYAKSSVEQE